MGVNSKHVENGGGGQPIKVNSKPVGHGSAKIRIPGNWGIEAGGQVLLRTSLTLRILIGIILVFALSSTVLHWRIRRLEESNKMLQVRLERMENLLKDFDAYPGEYEEVEEEDSTLTSVDANEIDFDEATRNSTYVRVRRSVQAENQNGTSILREEAEDAQGTSSTIKPSGGKIRRRGGRKSDEKGRVGQLKKSLKKLAERLRALRSKYLKLSAGAGTNKASTESITECPKAKASYMTIYGNAVSVEQQEQVIGPWYHVEQAKEWGFKDDAWLYGIKLDRAMKTITFEESGLFLISAQFYYHITYGLDEKPAPMGFRIYLRKYDKSIYARDVSLAECVPSFPSTAYQTCYTQIAWYIEKNDIVYLGHFKKSQPMIQSEDMGQTFLSIVKL